MSFHVSFQNILICKCLRTYFTKSRIQRWFGIYTLDVRTLHNDIFVGSLDSDDFCNFMFCTFLRIAIFRFITKSFFFLFGKWFILYLIFVTSMDCYRLRIEFVGLHFNLHPTSFPQLLWYFLLFVVCFTLDPKDGHSLRLFLPFLAKFNLKALLTPRSCIGLSFTCPDWLVLDAKEKSQLLLLLPKDLPVEQAGDEGGEEGGGGGGDGDAGRVACLGGE